MKGARRKMTREQFEQAEKLNQEIKKYEDLIDRIRQGISYKTKADKMAQEIIEKRKTVYDDHNERWTLSRFFKLVFEGKRILAIPNYELAQGIEMDADMGLILTILDYLEKKKKEYESDFESIGACNTNLF